MPVPVSGMGRVLSLKSDKTMISPLRLTQVTDINLIAENMRAADIAEVAAASGTTPKICLLQSYLNSKPCITMVSCTGEPLAMGGVVPDSLNNRVGQIWLLGTDALVDDATNRMSFLRGCRSWINAMHREYDVLWNYMDARNAVHHRWIKWMGFTFIAKRPNWGVEGRLFMEFCKVSHV